MNQPTAIRKQTDSSSSENLSVRSYFIRHLIHEQQPVWIYLISGIRLKGYLVDADETSLLLATDENGHTEYQLVSQSSVATLQPEPKMPERTRAIRKINSEKTS